MSDVLVSVTWLQHNLDDVRLLDVRGEVATGEPRYRAYPDHYREGHVCQILDEPIPPVRRSSFAV